MNKILDCLESKGLLNKETRETAVELIQILINQLNRLEETDYFYVSDFEVDPNNEYAIDDWLINSPMCGKDDIDNWQKYPRNNVKEGTYWIIWVGKNNMVGGIETYSDGKIESIEYI